MEWEVPTVAALLQNPIAKFIKFAASHVGYDGTIDRLVCEWIHPLMLQAKAAASKEDNLNWWQAMNGPFSEEYWKAACVEVETLESMEAWDVVEREDRMNVLPSTWAFKCKCFPDGLIKKSKARFCARGDKQIEGVDFFDTYAPVVQWISIWLMLILECLLGLVSKQGDGTCAFLHAHLPEDEKVFVEMPLGFKQYDCSGRTKVLKLKRTLYGLQQSPRAFWQYVTERLQKCGMTQSEFNPCLFISDTVICVVYVDNLLFWSAEESHINSLGEELRTLGVLLEEEGNAAGFLGVQLTHLADGRISMTQCGLIERIITVLGMDEPGVKMKATLAERKPLVKDSDGAASEASFNYASVVGMLLYLTGHSRPDIAYAVNCAARYTFCPWKLHETALKRIG